MRKYIVVAVVLVCAASKKLPSLKEREPHGDVPPPPKHDGSHAMQKLTENSIGTRSHLWNPNSEQNAWELSGLREGDIMEDDLASRTALVEGYANRWPGAVVPYGITEDFNGPQKNIILGAMDDIQNKSCVRFRPYMRGDQDYIIIRKDKPGCWSFQGRKIGGQVVNLNKNSGCIYHGVALHELLHALGFVHQHTVPYRDDYVRIHWENIDPNKTDNFREYYTDAITDYGMTYDYQSILHYSHKAFSKNTLPTITPLMPGATIGNIEFLSDSDIKKLNIMYNCTL